MGRRRVTLRGVALSTCRGVASGSEWLFGVLSLLLGLSMLAALPVLQLLSLGYLLESSGRVARTGLRRGGLTELWVLRQLEQPIGRSCRCVHAPPLPPVGGVVELRARRGPSYREAFVRHRPRLPLLLCLGPSPNRAQFHQVSSPCSSREHDRSRAPPGRRRRSGVRSCRPTDLTVIPTSDRAHFLALSSRLPRTSARSASSTGTLTWGSQLQLQ